MKKKIGDFISDEKDQALSDRFWEIRKFGWRFTSCLAVELDCKGDGRPIYAIFERFLVVRERFGFSDREDGNRDSKTFEEAEPSV